MATYSTSKRLMREYKKQSKSIYMGFGPARCNPRRFKVTAIWSRSGRPRIGLMLHVVK